MYSNRQILPLKEKGRLKSFCFCGVAAWVSTGCVFSAVCCSFCCRLWWIKSCSFILLMVVDFDRCLRYEYP